VSEIVRVLGLLTALPTSLLLLAMGLAEATQTSSHDWTLFVIGAALLVLTVPPLLFGPSGSSGRTRSGSGAPELVPGHAR
jgi:hypothetical protein